jgi:hypothetical protein
LTRTSLGPRTHGTFQGRRKAKKRNQGKLRRAHKILEGNPNCTTLHQGDKLVIYADIVATGDHQEQKQLTVVLEEKAGRFVDS